MIPILAAALLGAGLFLFLCDIRRVPTLRTAGAVTVTIKRQKQKDDMLQRWRRDIAAWLAKHLRLNEYKRLQLEADLHSADLSGKAVYPFATNGGWLGHTFKDIEKACRGAKVKAGLNVRFNGDRQLTSEADVQMWIQKITT